MGDVAGGVDGEVVWAEECACGEKYEPWDLTVMFGDAIKMPCCGRSLRPHMILELKEDPE